MSRQVVHNAHPCNLLTLPCDFVPLYLPHASAICPQTWPMTSQKQAHCNHLVPRGQKADLLGRYAHRVGLVERLLQVTEFVRFH